MKFSYAAVLVISLLCLNGCAVTPDTSCTAQNCPPYEADKPGLSVWWSPVLRDGGGEYSTVSLND